MQQAALAAAEGMVGKTVEGAGLALYCRYNAAAAAAGMASAVEEGGMEMSFAAVRHEASTKGWKQMAASVERIVVVAATVGEAVAER